MTEDHTPEDFREHIREWIDRDEEAAQIAVDEFLRACSANGVTPTFEEYYGSIVQMSGDDDLPEDFDPVLISRYVALGYVLRGRLDELMPGMAI